MNCKRHLVAIAGLLGLSCLVQVAMLRRATATGLDAVRFVRIAHRIDQRGLLPTLRQEREQSLFPAWVWVVHAVGVTIVGGSRSAWATSVQVAAAIPLVLVVVPAYCLMVRLTGSAAALAGSFFLCLLPEVSRLGADGISDSTHLLFFCMALWAMVEYFGDQRRGSLGWLLVAGLAMALAVLARMEVLVLGGAFAAALLGFQLLPGRRQPWGGLAAAAACFVLGLAVVLGPYLVAMGCVTPASAIARLSGRDPPERESRQSAGAEAGTPWRLSDGQPASFAAKEPSVSLRRRGYPAAIVRLGRRLAEAFGYWIGASALLGAWWLRRRPASNADRFVQAFFILFSLTAVWFAAAEGYLVPRHLLVLVVVGIGAAGYGALELGDRIADWAGRGRRPTGRGAVAWGVVALVGLACLPRTFTRLHHSRLGHRAAGEWLARQAPRAGTVLDTRGWTGLYSGRRTYLYEDAPTALRDPSLAYLVFEKREMAYASGRSRTLRWLIEAAAEPAAEFPGPAVRRPNQQAVVVYRWDPDRFRRCVASAR